MSFLIRARMNNQIRTPETATTPNARLNLCRKATGLVPCMFQPSEQRPREVVSMFRSSDLQSAKAREESEPVFDTSSRVPRIPAKRSHTKKLQSRTAHSPDADDHTFTPKSQLLTPSQCSAARKPLNFFFCLANRENLWYNKAIPSGRRSFDEARSGSAG